MLLLGLIGSKIANTLDFLPQTLEPKFLHSYSSGFQIRRDKYNKISLSVPFSKPPNTNERWAKVPPLTMALRAE